MLVNVTPNLFFFPGDIRLKSPLATIHTNVDMAMVRDNEFCKDYDAAVAH